MFAKEAGNRGRVLWGPFRAPGSREGHGTQGVASLCRWTDLLRLFRGEGHLCLGVALANRRSRCDGFRFFGGAKGNCRCDDSRNRIGMARCVNL
jgi:hypothetical protein